MTNLLDDLVYTTLANARDTSDVFTASVPIDAELTTLLTEAQWIIDDYIGYYWTPFVEWQTFIFPVCDDVPVCGTCTSGSVPTDIQIATIQIAEYLYLQWPTTLAQLSKKEVDSESNLSRSVSYNKWASGSYRQYIESIQIPKKTLNILNKYRSQFIWQVV